MSGWKAIVGAALLAAGASAGAQTAPVPPPITALPYAALPETPGPGPYYAAIPGGPATATALPPTDPAAALPPTSLGPIYQLPPAPAAASPVVSPTPVAAVGPSIESTWYTRVDYFHWNERMDGADFVNESGALYTLGYVRRVNNERFRAEFFGGDVHYDGSAQSITDPTQTWPLSSDTRYLGGRGEYELLFGSSIWREHVFFLGLGTRFWIRELPDDTLPDGTDVQGYQETWWTIYPYLGLEGTHPLTERLSFFSMLRAGATPVTYQYATYPDQTLPLHPRCGATCQAELGLAARIFP